jgi:putative nucleotidyltransferase with HDIG domain
MWKLNWSFSLLGRALFDGVLSPQAFMKEPHFMDRFWAIFLSNLLVASLIGVATFSILYSTAFGELSDQLRITVENRKQLIIAIDDFSQKNRIDYPGGPRAATLAQLEKAHGHFETYGRTGEFTVGKRQNGSIAYIFRQRHSGLQKPAPVPFNSTRAEPMRRALLGQSGTVTALDYSGEQVLAAYTPVEELGIGLVAKIDLAEVRAPFYRDSMIAFGISIVLLGLSRLIFTRLSGPIKQELLDSEALYRHLIEGQSSLVCRTDPSGRISFANEACAAYFRPILGELEGQLFNEVIAAPFQPYVAASLESLNTSHRSQQFTVQCPSADTQRPHWIEWTATLAPETASKDPAQSREIICVGLDVTERKQAEAALFRAERARRLLLSCTVVLGEGRTPMMMLNSICKLIASDAGYRLAWIGHALDDKSKKIVPIAQSGPDTLYLKGLDISWGNDIAGKGPTGSAVRSGKTVAFQSLHDKEGYAAFWGKAARFKFQSSAVIPLSLGALGRGCLNIYSHEAEAFSAKELELLEALANELSAALDALSQQQVAVAATQQAAESEQLRKNTLLEAVSALAQTIEKRDPYTAGHQHNVAKLAVKLATEMALDKDQIDCIRMGATIHDIGKISVPAQILTKPSKLTDVEFELIKQHSTTGFEIICDIHFDQPVAQIVHQHHERLDGSGYPLGLKGDQITLEARVVAVADVVDAIISHRPYRAALGIQMVMDELEDFKGTRYDIRVVDAFFKLAKEPSFLETLST